MIIIICLQVLVVIFITLGVIKMYRNNKEIQKLQKKSKELSMQLEQKLRDVVRKFEEV